MKKAIVILERRIRNLKNRMEMKKRDFQNVQTFHSNQPEVVNYRNFSKLAEAEIAELEQAIFWINVKMYGKSTESSVDPAQSIIIDGERIIDAGVNDDFGVSKTF